MITDKKYETLIGEIREISSDIARLDADLTKDRQDLQDFRVQMSTMTSEVEELRKELNSVLANVSIKVKESLEPAIDEVKKLKKEIGGKKTIALKNISIWSLLKFGGKNNKNEKK